MVFPGASDGKESACDVGDLGSVCGLGRSPGEGNGYPLQYFCLESPIDRSAWQATAHGVRVRHDWVTKHTHMHICSAPQAVPDTDTTTTTKSLQSCTTLCDPIDGSPPGSPVPGILQATVLEWVATAFSEFSLQYPPKKAQDTVSDTSELRVKGVGAGYMLSEAKECLYKLYSASWN